MRYEMGQWSVSGNLDCEDQPISGMGMGGAFFETLIS